MIINAKHAHTNEKMNEWMKEWLDRKNTEQKKTKVIVNEESERDQKQKTKCEKNYISLKNNQTNVKLSHTFFYFTC